MFIIIQAGDLFYNSKGIKMFMSCVLLMVLNIITVVVLFSGGDPIFSIEFLKCLGFGCLMGLVSCVIFVVLATVVEYLLRLML